MMELTDWNWLALLNALLKMHLITVFSYNDIQRGSTQLFSEENKDTQKMTSFEKKVKQNENISVKSNKIRCIWQKKNRLK